MPDPVGQCRVPSSVPTTDDVLREAFAPLPDALGGTPRASASAAHHGHDHVPDVGAHAAATVTEAELDLLAPLVEGSAGGAAMELGAGVMSYLQLFGAWYEADVRGEEYDSNVLRGGVLALEGRMDDIPAGDTSGLRDGAERVEWLAQHDPAAFERLRTAIDRITREGSDAVYQGRDSGCAFDARYETDLAFRHGVDRARGERHRDPAAFEAHQRESRALQDDLRRGMGAGGVRG